MEELEAHPHYTFNAALALIGDNASFYQPLNENIAKDWAQFYYSGFLVHIIGGDDGYAHEIDFLLTPYDDCPRSRHGQILRALCQFLEYLPGVSITLHAKSDDGHFTKNVITSKSTDDQLFKD